MWIFLEGKKRIRPGKTFYIAPEIQGVVKVPTKAADRRSIELVCESIPNLPLRLSTLPTIP